MAPKILIAMSDNELDRYKQLYIHVIIRRDVRYHGYFSSATEVVIFSSKKVVNQSLLSKQAESQV